MTTRDDHLDRLVHVLLEEQYDESATVDVSEQVLASAWLRPRVLSRVGMGLAAAAAILLAVVLVRHDRDADPLAWLDAVDTAGIERSVGRFTIDDTSTRLGAGPSDAGEPDLDAPGFVGQFPFAFRLPATLPGGWRLRRARVLTPQRAQLVYDRGESRLSAVLWAWSGSDLGPEHRGGDRRFTVLRTNGLGIAMEGGRATDEIWLRVASAFAPEAGH